MTQGRRKTIWMAGMLLFLLAYAAVGVTVGIPMIRLAQSPDLFRKWVDSFGILGKLLFVGMVFLQVLVALIPGEPVEMAAGYAFGAAEGFLLTMTGILLGSITVFLLVRWLGVRFVAVFFGSKEIRRLSFLKNPKKSFLLAFVLMMIPGTPKDLLSYFAGLTPLSFWQWTVIVLVGRIPSVLTSVVTGAAAGEKNYTLACAVFLATLAVSLIGILKYRKICDEQTE